MIDWIIERDGEAIGIGPNEQLLVQVGGALDLAIDAAVRGGLASSTCSRIG